MGQSAKAKNKLITAPLGKAAYASAFFFVFCILMFLKLPEYAHTNTVAYYYCLDYSMGFCPRMFMGTVLSFLLGGHLSDGSLYIASLVATVCVCALVSVFLGDAVARLEKQRAAVVCLSLSVLLYPFSVNFFFSDDCFGRLETWCLLFSLLAVLIADKRGLRWLVPALCFAAMATYEGFVFTFMPIIGVVLLYKVISGGFKAKDVSLCAVSYAVIIISFVYFQFASQRPVFNDVFEMLSAVSVKYSGEFDSNARDALEVMYYLGKSSYWTDTIVPIQKDLCTYYLPVLLAILLPMAGAFVCVWVRCVKQAQTKIEKFFFSVCALLPAAALPMYILATDWGRWTACWVCVQLITLLYLGTQNNNTFACVMLRVSDTVKKHPLFAALFIVFSASMYLSTKPDAIISSIQSETFENWKNWLEALY